MECEQCQRRESMLLDALITADKAETDLRCFFLTHLTFAGVSDLDEYAALRSRQLKAAETRHRAYLESVEHWKSHEYSPAPDGGPAQR